MLDLYICEDDAKQREFVTNFITDYCIFRNLDAKVVLSSPDPEEILAHYKNALGTAMFFLDIDLKANINGMELAIKIRDEGKKAAIAFLTTHSEMTLLTFEYKIEALDFIIKDKPDNIKRKIAECITTAIEWHTSTNKNNTIRVTVDDKIIFLELDEIIYIETTQVRHKLRLYTQRRMLEFSGELIAMEEKLDERFIRCHKSCIINRDKIKEIDKKANTVTMSNNSTCPISKTGKKLL